MPERWLYGVSKSIYWTVSGDQRVYDYQAMYRDAPKCVDSFCLPFDLHRKKKKKTSKFSEFSSPAFEICFEGYYL